MKEVIERIVSTESEARSIIEKAKTEGDQIIAEAKRKAQDMIEKAKRDAVIEAQNIINSAIEKAEKEKEKMLIQKSQEIKGQFFLSEEAKQKTVEWIIKKICMIT
ncbi:MAG: hypothetical protein N2596_01045 [Syntrophorhabdaceae bacterium]|nr:hypothetical protein [Syntrophorhabdaceae bacterium]